MTRASLLSLAMLLGAMGAARADQGHPLAGTWTGSLKAGNESLAASARVSAAGRPIYDYATKSGARSVELTHKGQRLRFVPPGGGVANVTVTDYAVTRAGFRYQLKMWKERSSGAFLDQQATTVTLEGKLVNGQLAVVMTVATQSTVSAAETGFTRSTSARATGAQQSVTLRGTLKRK